LINAPSFSLSRSSISKLLDRKNVFNRTTTPLHTLNRGVDLKKGDLKVIEVNKPSKEGREQKIKELCYFLKKTWPSVKSANKN